MQQLLLKVWCTFISDDDVTVIKFDAHNNISDDDVIVIKFDAHILVMRMLLRLIMQN